METTVVKQKQGTDRNISIEELNQTPVYQREVELVERKGVGHPDSVCDGIAEAVSRGLSRYYLKEYGRILHHNTDQVEVVGGQSAPKFGGGRVLEPVYILLMPYINYIKHFVSDRDKLPTFYYYYLT